MQRKKIAVFFGGKSFEHDVSIITGIDVVLSLDSTKYDPFPVYVDLDGVWWTGRALLDKKNYHLTDDVKKTLSKVSLHVGENSFYLESKGCFFKKAQQFPLDLIFPAFHGDYGEDGKFQGLCEMSGIPYAGGRVLSSALFMNKSATKALLKEKGIPVLKDEVIQKPTSSLFDIDVLAKEVSLPFPLIVKPNTLGSSVGVLKADDTEGLKQGLLNVFALGDDALIEPFVDNLEEYNISVTQAFGEAQTSVIERPLKEKSAFLGFHEKYLAAGGTKGTKSASTNKNGLLALTRVFNPEELTKEETAHIQEWAKKAFLSLNTKGVVRIDFMCNSKTREFYLGEVNTIPGSFAYYLWEASSPKKPYTELLSALIEEGFNEAKKKKSFSLSASHSLIFNRP